MRAETQIKKYQNRNNREVVRAFFYRDSQDFHTLQNLTRDVLPSLSISLSRVYENNWIIRHDNGRIEFVDCKNTPCFESLYEPYR